MRRIATLLLFTALGSAAFAQKLVNVQEESLRAPAGVKIDGKLTEWGDNFKTLNTTTNIYYTLANDDDNMYLVIKSLDQMNNNKIIGGGINLTINTANKKTEKDAYQLIFPVVDIKTLRSNMMAGMRAQGANGQPDSAAIQSMRRKAIASFKDVKLVNFKGIPDSVISIYNEYGVKGYVDFDSKGALIIEIALPLKEMKMDAGSAFTYNIKLNGINLNAIMPGAMAGGFGGNMGGTMGGGGGGNFGGGGGFSGAGGGAVGMPRNMGDIANMFSPTDFWGKYTLIKK